MNKVNNQLIQEYQEVDTPEKLLEFMSKNISYGYQSKNGIIYDTYDENWCDNYMLLAEYDILNIGVGNCFDQTELERAWFIKHNYEIKTVFLRVNLDYPNNYPMHSYLIYKDKVSTKWCWFENADARNRGIHVFDTIEEAINFQKKKYLEVLKLFEIKDEEKDKIIIKFFDKPKEHIGIEEYIEHILASE